MWKCTVPIQSSFNDVTDVGHCFKRFVKSFAKFCRQLDGEKITNCEYERTYKLILLCALANKLLVCVVVHKSKFVYAYF